MARATASLCPLSANLKVWNNGTVNYNFAATSGTLESQHVGPLIAGTLDVSAGGRFLEAVNGQRILKAGNVSTGTISTFGIGTVDLNDNDMQLTGSGATYTNVTDQIAYARNGGAWNRAGITSTAARVEEDSITGLGALLGSEYKSVHGANATFDGSTVGDANVLVMYTYNGDTDFNGVIDFDDVARTDQGFNDIGGTVPDVWHFGDFDYSDTVDFDDYVLLDAAFNLQGGSLRGGGDGYRWVETGRLWHFALRGYMDYFIDYMRRFDFELTEADFYPNGRRPPPIDVPEPTSSLLIAAFAAAIAAYCRRP